MDVASAIVGLLGVGAQVYSTLNTFVSTCQDAPFIAHTTRDEVRDFHYALDRLRHYVWQREQITPLGRATTDTTQLRLTVASSMATFNQVEKILNRLLVQSKMDYIQRIRWALSDGDLAKLLTRIQQHKVTLILLLTIWSSDSSAQAEASNDLLNDTLTRLLDRGYRGPSQPPDLSIYNNVLYGNASGNISHTSISGSNMAVGDARSLMTVGRTVSLRSVNSLTSKLRNTRPYASIKAFDSSAQSVLTSERATPWSEFTIGSNASVFALPFTASWLDLDTKKISEVKELPRVFLPIDGMTFYNDWRYPEINSSLEFPTGGLCILLSIFGLKAKNPRTGTNESGHPPTASKYKISPSLPRSLSQDLARHVSGGGELSTFLNAKLLSGITQNDLQSIDLLLSWSSQKRFGPSIGDELADAFREVVYNGNIPMAELFVDWGACIEVLHREPDHRIFEFALKSPQLDLIELFLIHGVDGEKGYGNPPCTPLQGAAIDARHGLAKLLLDRGVNIEGSCEEEHRTPLELAIEAGNYEMITLLLDRGANPEKAGHGIPPCTPLQAAAMGRVGYSIDLAKFLLDRGVSIEGSSEEDRRTPLEIALDSGNYDMIIVLLGRGANTQRAGYEEPSYSPLQVATMSRFDKCLGFAQLLLDRGVNVEECCQEERRTPLELAIEAGNYEMITLLLDRGANAEKAGHGIPPCTPLQTAAMGRYPHRPELAQFLLGRGVNIEGNCKEEPKKPLELAIEAGDYRMTRVLLDHGANPEKGYGKPPLTPLQAAALGRYPHRPELAQFLLGRGVNIEGNCKEEPKKPLELAIEAGDYRMTRVLLDHGANPEKGYGKPPLTPLQAAALGRYPHRPELAQFLLGRGVNIEGNCKEERKKPLELAIEAGNYKMLSVLLDHGANPDKGYGNPRCTPLQKAAIGLHDDPLTFARFLLDRRVNIEGSCKEESKTPLQLAILYGSSEMISMLLDRGANPDKGYPYTALQAAATGTIDNSLHIAQLLLAGRANIESHTAKEPRTPLQISIDNKDHAMIDLFLACGADINKYYGQPIGTALQKAIDKEDHPMIQRLLEHGANTEKGYGNPKRTPLQAIAKMQRPSFVPIARMLVNWGAVIDGRTDNMPRTPLELAIEMRNVPIALFLIHAGAKVEGYHDTSSMVPMQLAAKYGDGKIVTKLLDQGANIDRCTKQVPSTPLQIAVQMESEEVVRVLTRRGANVESRCEGSPKTALQIAVEMKSKNIVRILLKAGAKQQGCTREYMCPIHMALVAGSEELLEILSAKGVNPAVVCDQYLTDHYAVYLVD
ncbi:uncharacterized protein H6S33_007090 [Morchella sextelata]|uniref:uncharacterized protein n=1 Tax=Morchella sextelata TaxID=1174677 RepID=UPI001D05550B|nr:uncharacterized protein H6S33_007090 [Morchella sextelata]KAH0604059.1 hypothetical protein H6S33_007090 [Morchella sextelata]